MSRNRLIKRNDFEFRQLILEHEIQAAMQLLHTVYILEQGWLLLESNQSMLRIESLADKKMVVDKFSNDAHWFGAFHKETLVGCLRVLPYPMLELKEYRKLPSFIDHSGVCEMNRLAVLPAYRSHKFVMVLLIRLALDHAFSLGSTVYVTATTPQPAKLFEKLGFIRANLLPFKYNEAESVKVELLYGKFSDRNNYSLYRLSDRLMISE